MNISPGRTFFNRSTIYDPYYQQGNFNHFQSYGQILPINALMDTQYRLPTYNELYSRPTDVNSSTNNENLSSLNTNVARTNYSSSNINTENVIPYANEVENSNLPR